MQSMAQLDFTKDHISLYIWQLFNSLPIEITEQSLDLFLEKLYINYVINQF